MDATPARSVYELHVINPTTQERHRALIGSVLAELVAGLTAGTLGGGSTVRLTLEVVDLRSGTSVMTMRELPAAASRLAKVIDADLDRFGAAAFAKEWGVEPPRDACRSVDIPVIRQG